MAHAHDEKDGRTQEQHYAKRERPVINDRLPLEMKTRRSDFQEDCSE